MQTDTIKNRTAAIKNLYVTLLEREADRAGLDHYVNSGLPLQDIERIIKSSPEYLKKNPPPAKPQGSAHNFFIGPPPRTDTNMNKLLETGVTCIVNLGGKHKEPLWNTKKIKKYKHVDIFTHKNKSLEIKKVRELLDFLVETTSNEGEKVYVYSSYKNSMAAGIIAAAYLSATVNADFKFALLDIFKKTPDLAVEESLLTPEFIRVVSDKRNEIKGKSKDLDEDYAGFVAYQAQVNKDHEELMGYKVSMAKHHRDNGNETESVLGYAKLTDEVYYCCSQEVLEREISEDDIIITTEMFDSSALKNDVFIIDIPDMHADPSLEAVTEFKTTLGRILEDNFRTKVYVYGTLDINMKTLLGGVICTLNTEGNVGEAVEIISDSLGKLPKTEVAALFHSIIQILP